jgi:hypothetical protein
MVEALVTCGYKAAMIKTLTNRDATRDNILDHLTWLLKNNNPGDSLVFYFSGHGSYRNDTNGDEPDGKDEVICPHQSLTFISDDVLHERLKELPGTVNLDVFLDCCHSGSGIREDGEIRVRFMDPPKERLARRAEPRSARFMAPREEASDHTLWAACRSDQKSFERPLEGKVRGVFTYHLTRELLRTQGNIKRSELHKRVKNAISIPFKQEPQLETDSTNRNEFIFT